MTPRFSIADCLPRIVLPTGSGRAVDLTDQAYAGDLQAIWVTKAATAETLGEARRLVPQFRACGARLFHLITAQPTSAVPEPATDWLIQLFDPQATVPSALGLAGEGTILIDGANRLVAVEPDANVERLLAQCRAVAMRNGPSVVHAPVLVVERVIEPELCRALIELWEKGTKEEDAVASGGHGNQVTDTGLKRRSDVVVQDKQIYEAVRLRIERRVAPQMVKAFQFTPARVEALRVGCYDALRAGAFRRHRDNMTPYTAHRKFAMSLNLNDGYQGGTLAFPEFSCRSYRPSQGEAVVFSCSLVHEAQPVTQGRRFGLFTFFTDQAGAAQEDAMLAKFGPDVRRYQFT